MGLFGGSSNSDVAYVDDVGTNGTMQIIHAFQMPFRNAELTQKYWVTIGELRQSTYELEKEMNVLDYKKQFHPLTLEEEKRLSALHQKLDKPLEELEKLKKLYKESFNGRVRPQNNIRAVPGVIYKIGNILNLDGTMLKK